MKKYFDLNDDVQWFGFLSILSAFLRKEYVRTTLTKIDDVFSRTALKYVYWQFSGIAKKRLY